jgi:hypothetical protein
MTLRFWLPLVSLLAAFGSVPAGQTGSPVGAGLGPGRIEGRVVTGDGSIAVRRAIVTISGDLPRSRSAISDDNGAFRFDNLPAGRFALSAVRPAFITAAYGAKAPGQPGTRISLAAGQTITGALIHLPRGAVITGTVRNESGEPLPSVQVAIAPARAIDQATATRVSVGLAPDPSNVVMTNDRGVYRAFGLAPGSYFVVAFLPQRVSTAAVDVISTAQMDEAFNRMKQGSGRSSPSVSPPVRPKYGYAPIFFPGTADPGSAATVTVTSGEERSGVDLSLTPVPAVEIEGEVVSPSGAPLPRVQLALTPDAQVPAIPTLRQTPSPVVQPVTLPVPSGRFKYTGVTAGRYTLTARTLPGQVTGGPDGSIASIRSAAPGEEMLPHLWASADLTVSSGDIQGVQLNLRAALGMTGRLQFDGTLAPPANLTALRVTLSRVDGLVGGSAAPGGTSVVGMPVPTATVRADGTFDLAPVFPGTYRITAGVPAAGAGGGWRLRSAEVDGRDVLDEPLVVGASDTEIPPAVLTYSDRRTEINGSLQTPGGTPATDYFIVVFSTERRWWIPGSRRLAFARPATDGQFTLRDLPPGDYQIAALTDLDTDAWETAEFLEQLAPLALRLTLAEGETKRQDLRIAQ